MNRNYLIEQMQNLQKNKAPATYTLHEQLKLQAYHYIALNPKDLEFQILFAMALYQVPMLDDFEEIFAFLEKFIRENPNNFHAIIFYAYLKLQWDTYNVNVLKLVESIKSNNLEELSIRSMYIANYYENECNDILQEKYLLEAITLCDTYVQHYFNLAKLYLYQNKILEGKKMLLAGIKNIKHIQKEGQQSNDELNIQFFFDAYIKHLYSHELIIRGLNEEFGIN